VRAPLHSEEGRTGNFELTMSFLAWYAEASYFGQVCSTGLTKEGTECIMGEPQVRSTFILNLSLHSQPRVSAEGYGLGFTRRRSRAICAETSVFFMRGLLVVSVVLDREALWFDHLPRNRDCKHEKNRSHIAPTHSKHVDQRIIFFSAALHASLFALLFCLACTCARLLHLRDQGGSEGERYRG
jgi:hypothetical protein